MNKNGDTNGKGDKPQEQSPMAFMYSYAEKCKVRMDYLCWFTKGNVSLKFQISYVDACIYFILCFVWVGVFLGCCFQSSRWFEESPDSERIDRIILESTTSKIGGI